LKIGGGLLFLGHTVHSLAAGALIDLIN